MGLPDNLQDIENLASNWGAQGNFHAPVTVEQSQHAQGRGIAQADRGSNANVNINQVTVGANAERFKAIYQLPDPVKHFVGRAEIIARVTQHLLQAAQQSGVTALIRGMGGVGKSQLAYTIAHQLRDHFPDGQLLIDAFGTKEQPRSAQEIMQRIIQAFLPEAEPADDLDQTQGHYRSLLRDKQVLMLVDDVRDADQIAGLIPPRGCALLVTARHHFSFSHAFALLEDLKDLQSTEAEELLQTLCSRLDAHQAARLAALCGRLPLALHISAGRLANDPIIRVPDYLERLADVRQRLDLLSDPISSSRDIESVLQVSYDLLNAAEQTALRQMTVFPASFDQEAAKKVIELKGIRPVQQGGGGKQRGRAVPPGIDDVLSSLYRQSWLEYDSVTERYRLHDVVRAFAMARLTRREDGRHWRYAVYYAGVLGMIEALYYKGGEHILEGLQWFDRDQVHIDAGRNWADEHQDDKLLLAYAIMPGGVLRLRYHPRYQRSLLTEAALAAARRQQQRKVESKLLLDLGNAYFDNHDLQQACECYQQGLELARQTHYRQIEGVILGSLGNVHHALGDYQRARDYSEQALAIIRTFRDRRNEGAALISVGHGYYHLREFSRAKDYYEQGLAIACEIGDRHNEGKARTLIGHVHHRIGEYSRAKDYYEQALAIDLALGDLRGKGSDLSNLGIIYFYQGEYMQARTYQEQALTIARTLDDRKGEGTALKNLGCVYNILGNYAQAWDYQEQALAIARALRDRNGEGTCLVALGSIYHSLGEYSQAEDCYEQALVIARELDNRGDEGNRLNSIGLVYDNLGEYLRALNYFEQALAIARSLGDRQSEGIIFGNLGQVYARLGDTTQAITLAEQSLHLMQEIGHRNNEGYAYKVLGKAWLAAGDIARARAYQEQALQIAVDGGYRPLEAEVRCYLGELLLMQGELAEATTQLTQALTLAQEMGRKREVVLSNWHLGRVCEQQGELVQAVALMQGRVAFYQAIGHAEVERYVAQLAEVQAKLVVQAG